MILKFMKTNLFQLRLFNFCMEWQAIFKMIVNWYNFEFFVWQKYPKTSSVVFTLDG